MKKRMALKSRRFGKGDPQVMIDINTTPLIDVMLVLLVMLIITIPIQLHAVNLAMPVAVPPDRFIQPEVVRIDIDGKSVVLWQGQPVTAQELDEKMALVAQQAVPPEIHLRADKDARYAVFANVLSTSRRKGLTKIGIVGNPQPGR